jgi:CTD small phosphatase-like protein 2
MDLDETLIHASRTPRPFIDESLTVETSALNLQVFIGRRPKLMEFLAVAAEAFELVLFTASEESYATQVLNSIDPGRKLLRHRLFRDSCVMHTPSLLHIGASSDPSSSQHQGGLITPAPQHTGIFVKDLRCLGRDLRHVVIVDNNPASFLFQPHNGIPISSWYGSQEDTELEVCLRFLFLLAETEDVRPVLKHVCNFNPAML